jgi:hypothetical protein
MGHHAVEGREVGHHRGALAAVVQDVHADPAARGDEVAALQQLADPHRLGLDHGIAGEQRCDRLFTVVVFAAADGQPEIDGVTVVFAGEAQF